MRLILCLILLTLPMQLSSAANPEFVIHPSEIANVYRLVGGVVVISFTPEKAREFARLSKHEQHVRILVPHPGLTFAKLGFNSIELGFTGEGAVTFYKTCRNAMRR